MQRNATAVVFFAVVLALFGAGALYQGPVPATPPELEEDSAQAVAAPHQGPPLEVIASWFPADGHPDDTSRVEAVRDFIYTNSEHRGAGEEYEHAWNTTRVIDRLYDHANDGSPPPYLSCGPRARAMAAVLTELGYDSRPVHVYSDEYDNVRSHTFLEVWLPDVEAWAAFDPDFGLHYEPRHATTEAPLPTRVLLFGDLDDVVPCDGAGTCGWDDLGVAHLHEDYFEAAMYDRRAEGRQSLMLANDDRFDLEKAFAENDNMTFPEFVQERYENTRLIATAPA